MFLPFFESRASAWRLTLILLAAMCGAATTHAEESLGEFFQSHCTKCHGVDKQEGDLRLDRVTKFSDAKNSTKTWAAILEKLESGEMPPQDEPQPTAESVERIAALISKSLAAATPRQPALRRMNRVEYEYTVRDLLGVETELADLLPEDSSVQGFDNVAGGLGLSAILMERYLEAADTAFDGVIRRIEPLPPATRRAVLMELKENKESVAKNKGGVIESHGALVDFTPGWPPARLDPAHPIEGGVYRCRVAVWPHEPNKHRTLSVGVFVGPLFGNGTRKFMGMYDVTGTPDEPRIIEFTTEMAENHAIHVLPWVFPEHVTYRDKHEARPGVAIKWAETHGPLDQSFPSKSQLKLFGDSSTISMKEGWPIYMRHRKNVKPCTVESSAPREDAERIIRSFATRAFRRPVADALTDQFVQLTLSRLDGGATFEQAVRAGVTAVLCSPHFLLLNQQKEVDDYTIASRLSYFLWRSMPDEELLRLAKEGKLSDPKIRIQQVDRMIAGSKSQRFVTDFTGQWLDLREIEFTTPDKKLYPEYDELLLRSMLAETHGFFRHVLDENLSVTNFIDSDFAVLNQRLATHYGIDGVRGHEKFRVVKLPADSIRGGLLTHASVLKVTANGTTTSPVIRGAWVLDHLLGRPPSPPPPGVAAVEPDIRGAVTIREQLAAHRENESCNRCHSLIDPPGFALEEFDVIGGHREWYRSLSDKGERIPNVRYRVGPDVEKGDQFSDGRKFANFIEFRELLLKDPDAIAEGLAKKLLVYGCGRPLTPADRGEVKRVVAAASTNNYGLRSMIHAVVNSELFLSP